MKKIITLLAFLMLAAHTADAKMLVNPINAAIRQSDVNKEAVSVAFVDIANPKNNYKLNVEKPLQPASIQKMITILPALIILGSDYEFKTQLYKDAKNNLYLKLGADPYFKTKDLSNLIKTAQSKGLKTINSIYIDDSILDSNEWGEGWQWDDDLNPLMPKFGSYNIDNNLLSIDISPTNPGGPADISTGVFYPTTFINNVLTGDCNNVKFERKNYISPDVINADGTVKTDFSRLIPVNHPRRYFIFRLEEILREQKYSYYGDFKRLKAPSGAVLIAEVKHPIDPAKIDILKNSNNMVAETVFKIAGGKFAKETGSFAAGEEMFRDFCLKSGLDSSKIKIVDASGVSKNNLMTADFIIDFLLKGSQNFSYDKITKFLPTAGEGTLTDRMLYFRDKIYAKTGTLSDISSIAGYLETKKGHTYAFCIMNNDPKSKTNDKKMFEEYLLRAAYESL